MPDAGWPGRGRAMSALAKARVLSPPRRQLDLGTIERTADGSPHPPHLTVTDHLLRHHMLVRGASGGGKSQFLKQLLWANILRGYFCCVIDPVGSLVPPTLEFLGGLMLKLFLRAGEGARAAWARQFVVLDFTDPN